MYPSFVTEQTCTGAGGRPGSCIIYFRCKPLLQLLTNLKGPSATILTAPPEIQSLLQTNLLCGRQNIGGLNMPKVCCPEESVENPRPPTTKKPSVEVPLTDEER